VLARCAFAGVMQYYACCATYYHPDDILTLFSLNPEHIRTNKMIVNMIN
jgi:hypothetical protein